MSMLYMLYGNRACELYDLGFDRLLRAENIKFVLEKYNIEDETHSIIIEKTKRWRRSREITVVQYGMLLKKLDDKK